MRPSSRRRTAVFAVCLAGVVALYWVPTAVRAPERLGVPAPAGAPTFAPVDTSGSPSNSAVDPAPAGSTAGASRPSSLASADDERSGTDGEGAPGRPDATGSTDRPGRPDRSASAGSDPATAPTTGVPTAGESTTQPPSAPSDETSAPTASDSPSGRPPATVRGLHVVQADYEGLTVGWTPASRAQAYQVSLNGYDVAGTTGTEAALRWFNDDMSEHFVQVRAVGADGQTSREAGFLRVTRPSSPAPSPTPEPADPSSSPSATPTAEASASGQPSPTAAAGSAGSASSAPTAEPSASATR